MNTRRAVVALVIGAVLAGCDVGKHPTQADVTPSSQAAEISPLRQEVDTLKAEVAELKKKQDQYEFERFLKDIDKIAYLRPGDDGYSTVRYDLGVLTVQLADVSEYANGSKVRLRFGNPLATAINGLKAKIEWGYVDENGSPDNTSAKSKDMAFIETLRPGAWTTVSVVLDGIPPAKLGFVRVRNVNHTGIVLTK